MKYFKGIKFFKGITDEDEGKDIYRSWAKRLHTDNEEVSDETDSDAMADLIEQYAEFQKDQGVEEMDDAMMDDLHIPQRYREHMTHAYLGYLVGNKKMMITGVAGFLANAVLDGIEKNKTQS